MKIVIFAGGTGRRLWPISRQRSPKQFEPIIGSDSTVQLAVRRVSGTFGHENILISTNERYLDILRSQLPELPDSNFIGEPIRRDLAAAVGLAMVHVERRFGPDEPVAIVWGDNYMTNEEAFLSLLGTAEGLLEGNLAQIVFVGETARYANNNLGWIGLGRRIDELGGRPYFGFKSWVYRPPLDECRRMFASGQYVWNTGYFVTTPGFVTGAYQRFQPAMWSQLDRLGSAIGGHTYDDLLHEIYPKLEVASFDDAIVQNITPDQAVVLHETMGWSDPGTLYALKEAINPDKAANVEKGLVSAHRSNDCLLYNYVGGKLLAAVGLQGMVVVNTEDALLVVHKDDISLVKTLVDGFEGTELDSYS